MMDAPANSSPAAAAVTPGPVAGRSRRRRYALLAAGCCLALSAGAVGIFLYNLRSAEEELQAAFAEADRTDPRWRFADLLEDRQPIPDAQNPSLVVMQVNALLGAAGFDLGEQNEQLFDELRPNWRLNTAQVKALRTGLGDNAAAVDLARTLKDYHGEGRFPIAYSPDFLGTNCAPLQHCRAVMRLLECDARLRAEEGDVSGAMQSTRATLSAARSIGREPMLVSALVRFAGNATVVNSLERVLAQGEPPQSELEAMQQLLEQEIDAPVLLEALRGERAGADQLLALLQTRHVKRSAFVTGKIGSFQREIMDWLPATISGGRAEQLRLMTRAVETVKLTVEQQGPALEQIDRDTIASGSDVVRALMPAIARVAKINRRTQANLRAAMVALAVERYRIKHERWPETLGAVVEARLLLAVPLDPCNGQPLRYQVRADGIIVYSVGLDGNDDGGQINRAHFDEPGSDLGMRLWNPSARRQLPPPR
jgi:hypothetical protein